MGFAVAAGGCPDGGEMTTGTGGPSTSAGPTSTTPGTSGTATTAVDVTTSSSGDPTEGSTGVGSSTMGVVDTGTVGSTSAGATDSTTSSGSTGSTGGSSSGSTGGSTGSTGSSSSSGTGSSSGGMVVCDDLPPMPAGPEVQLAPAFADAYKTFELGPVPGVAPGARLGGCVISNEDPNVLLIAAESEAPSGKIYAVDVIRGNCDHIVAFKGTSKVVANTPYVDANLVLIKSGLMFYTAWPVNQISQLLPGQMAPAQTTNLGGLGVESSVSGLGFVPPGYADEGDMRIVTWSGGKWYHLDRTPNGELYTLSNAKLTATIPNGPGGFAYVPSGSPGFMVDHVIVSEWSVNKVGVHEVDAAGDPKPATRKDFFTVFPRPWGAYFEPLTGDFLFLTWGVGTDKVYIVQGFQPPPPIPQ